METVFLVISILMLFIGLTGNTFSFAVFTTKKMQKILTHNVYRVLAIVDSFYLVLRITQNFVSNNDAALKNISYLNCKLFSFINPAFGPISGWLLVYISLERFVSISLPRFKFLQKKYVETSIVLAIFFYNILLYIPFEIYTSYMNKTIENSNKTKFLCRFKDKNTEQVLLTIDLINLSLLPFGLMFILSIMLIYTIFKSRKRLTGLNNQQENARLIKYIKFAVTSIFLNISFILLNLPFAFGNLSRDFLPYLYIVYSTNIYLFSYCINFYIFLATNSIFKKSFFNIFRKFRQKTI